MSIRKAKPQVKPLSMRAEIGVVDAEKRTFEVIWTVGAKVLRSSWYDGNYYEELSLDPAHVRMGRLTSGRSPFLADHNKYEVSKTLGVIEAARLEKGRGVATVRFPKEGIDPEADKVFAKIADRIINNVSVGYRTFKVEKIESQEEKVPTLRAIDWEPHEVSAVTIGADADAFIRVQDDASTNDLEVIEVTPLGAPSTTNERAAMDPEELKRQEEAKRQAELAKRQAEEKAIVERAQQEERERIVGIRSAVGAAKLGEDVATRLINDKTSLVDARAFVLDELGKRETTAPITNQRVEVGDTDDDKFARMAIALLVTRAGAEAGGVIAEATAKKVRGFENLSLDAGDLRGFSMVELARETLHRKGVSTRGLDRNQMLALAFTHRSGPYAGVADFPVLLENVMGKILLGAYATTPDTWSRVCKIESVDDFRTSPRYRTGSLGVLEAVNENGEFKNLAIPDGKKLTIQTATKGKMIAITRQMIINDDMSAFADLTAKLGRSAKLSIETDFYALLAQNSGLGPTVGANPFFHSSNGNVNATASAIGTAGFDADRVIMAAQKDAENNEFLDIRPEILLIPSGQLAAARVVNNSAYDHDSTKLQKPNAVQGLFRDIIDTPRLSGTRRYLFANPSQVAAFVVAFLNGQQNPTIESKDGWRTDGTEMKVRLDYLVQPFDVKGALTNAGQ